MKIKQGTALPSTGIGVGYLFLLVYVITAYHIGFLEILKIPAYYFLLLAFSLMQFSYKDFIINDSDKRGFTIKYRILYFLPYTEEKFWYDYKFFIFKQINKTYRVSQGIGYGMTMNQADYREQYYSIVACKIDESENFEICMGTVKELNEIITKYILPTGIPVFKGARKKGYEYS
ncbi:MAG: hypothetical protein V4622_01745 [Bacteroidota bacterium]